MALLHTIVCPRNIYFGLKVALYKDFRAEVYSIWVHEPLGVFRFGTALSDGVQPAADAWRRPELGFSASYGELRRCFLRSSGESTVATSSRSCRHVALTPIFFGPIQ